MRARNLKPGFFSNELLGSADPLYGWLFAGLWGMADREGRLEDRPLRICATVFPYRRKVSEQAVDKMLTWLDHENFIRRYEISGKRFIQVLEFSKHQNPHVKEPPSKIPALSLISHRARTGPAPDQHQNDTGAARLIPDSLLPDSGATHLRPPHPTAEPVGRKGCDTGTAGKRENGTSPRQLGTNPRAMGTNPRRQSADARTINELSISAWTRACELIDEIHGTPGRTWAEVVDPKFPYLSAAIGAAGGSKAIADRDRYTTSRLKADFCTGYRVACEGAPRDSTGPKSIAEILRAHGNSP